MRGRLITCVQVKRRFFFLFFFVSLDQRRDSLENARLDGVARHVAAISSDRKCFLTLSGLKDRELCMQIADSTASHCSPKGKCLVGRCYMSAQRHGARLEFPPTLLFARPKHFHGSFKSAAATARSLKLSKQLKQRK